MSNHLVEAPPLPIPEPSPVENISKDDPTNKSASQNCITLVYHTKISESCSSVTVTWYKNPTDHHLCVSMGKTAEENKYTCKIDLISRQCWGKKGLKSFEVEGRRVDIFWDFRQAKFSADPQPCSDYYIALVCKKEVLLLVGDLEKDAYERTRSKPSSERATLLCKKQNVHGKKLFCTRAMLEEGKTEHDIVIETSLSGPDDPEMWISIDGMVATRIMNLNWKFRGNEAVMVNNFPVQIFWDVHDWLFNDLGSGQGFFIFKPGSLESTYSDPDNRDCPERGERSSKHDLVEENTSIKGFCHFLYAWLTK